MDRVSISTPTGARSMLTNPNDSRKATQTVIHFLRAVGAIAARNVSARQPPRGQLLHPRFRR
jgi:hypothetical protein